MLHENPVSQYLGKSNNHPHGEFVMLIGNNGAGKSTLLRIISSLMKPSKGQINFRGTKQNDNLLEWLRIMGNITHENRLYSDLNSKEFVGKTCDPSNFRGE